MPDIPGIDSPIQEICDQFRVRCERGEGLTPESFIVDLPAASSLSEQDRKILLVSLVKCEIDWARKSGRPIDCEDYSKRFPELPDQLFTDLFSMPEIPLPLSLGSDLPERYERISQIGAGGIGIVTLVKDRQMKRTVAIKVLKQKLKNSFSANQRLQREAILTGRLQHPGIPPIFDQGTLRTGSNYFAMKLVQGQTLDQILKSPTRELPFLLSVFEQLAQTIAYAHSMGIIHRDIKPQNVMIGAFGEVQVMDWGMAKDLNEAATPAPSSGSGKELKPVTHGMSEAETAIPSIDSSLQDRNDYLIATREGDILGTPAYMSPEQARGESNRIGPASDVFSLGALLYEILSGRRLFHNSSADETIRQVSTSDFAFVRKVLNEQDTDESLVDICCNCLAPDLKNRLPNGQAVAEAVSNYQTNFQARLKQSEIERSNALVQAAEIRKRSIRTTWLSGLVLAVSIIGASLFAWQWKKATIAVKNEQQAAKTNEGVYQFFVDDFLKFANPYTEPDKTLTVRDALKRSAGTIRERFADEPAVEKEIQYRIGLGFQGLGEYSKAKTHLSRCLELCNQLGNTDEDEIWDLRQALASIEVNQGNYEEGIAFYQELFQHHSRLSGPSSAGAITAKGEIAVTLNLSGKVVESEAILRKLVQAATEIPGFDLDDLDKLKSNWVNALIAVGDYRMAEEIATPIYSQLKSLADVEKEKWNGTPIQLDLFLHIVESLALVRENQHRYEEALKHHLEYVEIGEAWIGKDSPKALVGKTNVSNCLIRLDKLNEAKSILIEIIPKLETAVGRDHRDTFTAKNTLASLKLFEGDLEGSKRLFLEMRKSLETQIDFDPLDMLTNTNNLAGVYSKLKKYDLAERYYSEAVETAKQHLGELHPNYVVSLASLGLVRKSLGKFDEAEQNFLESIELSRGVFEINHPDTLQTMRDLAFMYQQNGEFEKAEEWMSNALIGYRDRLGEAHPRTILTKNLLAMIYKSLKRPGDAVPLLEDVFESHFEKFGPTHSKTVGVFFVLIKTEEEGKQFPACKKRLEEYLPRVQEDNAGWLELRIQYWLGRMAHQMGEQNEAKDLLVETFSRQQTFESVDSETRTKALRSTAKRLIKVLEELEAEEEVSKWKTQLKKLSLLIKGRFFNTKSDRVVVDQTAF